MKIGRRKIIRVAIASFFVLTIIATGIIVPRYKKYSADNINHQFVVYVPYGNGYYSTLPFYVYLAAMPSIANSPLPFSGCDKSKITVTPSSVKWQLFQPGGGHQYPRIQIDESLPYHPIVIRGDFGACTYLDQLSTPGSGAGIAFTPTQQSVTVTSPKLGTHVTGDTTLTFSPDEVPCEVGDEASAHPICKSGMKFSSLKGYDQVKVGDFFYLYLQPPSEQISAYSYYKDADPPSVTFDSDKIVYIGKAIEIAPISSIGDTYAWSTENYPPGGKALMTALQSSRTSVTFDTLGEYILRLKASNKVGEKSADIKIAVRKMGDMSGDGKIDKADFALLMNNWGDSPKNALADLDSDNKVGKTDFANLMYWWEK